MAVNELEANEAPDRVRDRAVGRWENEGESFTGLHQHKPPTVVNDSGDAEAGNLRVRLIAR